MLALQLWGRSSNAFEAAVEWQAADGTRVASQRFNLTGAEQCGSFLPHARTLQHLC